MRPDAKIALITGAGSGIGRALAIQAAALGIETILVGRRPEALSATASLLPGTAKAHILPADITEPADRAAIVDFIRDRFGRLDFLVNNAGSVAVGPFETMPEADFDRLLTVNLIAPAALIRLALPLLRHASAGRIVNVGSMFGDIAFPRFASYSATKFGLRGLSDGLRRELAADGIGVTYAAPRATKTPAADSFDALTKPMGMVLDAPEDIARKIWTAVLAGKPRVFPGRGERVATILQAMLPKLLDGHIAGLEKKVRKLENQAQ